MGFHSPRGSLQHVNPARHGRGEEILHCLGGVMAVLAEDHAGEDAVECLKRRFILGVSRGFPGILFSYLLFLRRLKGMDGCIGVPPGNTQLSLVSHVFVCAPPDDGGFLWERSFRLWGLLGVFMEFTFAFLAISSRTSPWATISALFCFTSAFRACTSLLCWHQRMTARKRLVKAWCFI